MESFVSRRDVLTTGFSLVSGSSLFATSLFAGVKPGWTFKLPIRVGQIGTGHAHAAGKWETINKFPKLFDVVGIAESEHQKRAAAEKRNSYANAKWITEAELLEKASLVVVETDVPDLVPTAVRCVEADKHLHLDKPGGTNLSDFTALLKLAEKKQALIQMGYMFRYNPAFQFLFHVVKEGWLGEIREINAAIGKKASPGVRKELGRYAGGGMFELACHLVDAVIGVMGPPTKIHHFNRATLNDGVKDNQLAVFEYPRATATIRCNHVDPFGGPRRQFSVIGTEGAIEIRPLEPPRATLMLDRPRGKYGKGIHLIELPKMTGRYDGDFQDLVAVLTGKKEFAWSYEHDLTVQKAVLESSGMSK